MFWSFCLVDFRGFCAAPVCSKTYIFVVRFDDSQGGRGHRQTVKEGSGKGRGRVKEGSGKGQGGYFLSPGPQGAATSQRYEINNSLPVGSNTALGRWPGEF